MGLRLIGMKARERTSPRPRKQVGETSSDRNDGTRKGLSSTMEASRRDSVGLERRRLKGLILDQGSKQARLRRSHMKEKGLSSPVEASRLDSGKVA